MSDPNPALYYSDITVLVCNMNNKSKIYKPIIFCGKYNNMPNNIIEYLISS